ncbi:MAG: hypothetical protein AAGB14_15170, partial [Verrucomicrobiota bacterium]
MATLVVMSLVAILVVGLLSLSTIELRRSKSGAEMADARGNARLALMHAIGQLQLELGPDQRVSATSGILGSESDPNWTGVWSTRREDGTTYWPRDPVSGSLTDMRNEEGWDAADRALAWLVSGNADPRQPIDEDASIELVGDGSVDDEESMIRVPLVTVESDRGSGGMAWWTGDLGVRANVAAPDRHADQEIDPSVPGRGQFRLMAAQHVEPAMMGAGAEIDDEQRASLVTPATLALAAGDDGAWSREHFHDFTTASYGLLTDVREGGLKGDLTAFFEGDGSIQD